MPTKRRALLAVIATTSLVGVVGTATAQDHPLLFPDCVCNRTRSSGATIGDEISAYFSSYVNHLSPGTIVGNITGSCARGFPGCEMNNYLVNGGFRTKIDSWEPDSPGFIYPYKYYGTIVPAN